MATFFSSNLFQKHKGSLTDLRLKSPTGHLHLGPITPPRVFSPKISVLQPGSAGPTWQAHGQEGTPQSRSVISFIGVCLSTDILEVWIHDDSMREDIFVDLSRKLGYRTKHHRDMPIKMMATLPSLNTFEVWASKNRWTPRVWPHGYIQ